MEGKAKPEYEKCVEISTQASIREMIAPGSLAIIAPAIVGFAFGPEALGGLLAGITVSGVLMGMFQNNAGGAWDNAKKSFEKGVEIDGKMEYKGSEPHKASVTGDTVGDPFKDTSGPSMNILIKLTSIVALIIAPHIASDSAAHSHEVIIEEVVLDDLHLEQSGNPIIVHLEGKDATIMTRHLMVDFADERRIMHIEIIFDPQMFTDAFGIEGTDFVYHADGETIDGGRGRYNAMGPLRLGDMGDREATIVIGQDQNGQIIGDLYIN